MQKLNDLSRRERCAWFGWLRPPFCTPSFPFLRQLSLASCADRVRHVFSIEAVGARPARPLDGLIWPQDGFASIALPQWRRRDFLPWAFHPTGQALWGTPVRPLKPQGRPASFRS
jgi:hypothetical protein